MRRPVGATLVPAAEVAEAVLLGCWMGIMAFIFPVALTAFAVLPTRDLAGNVVGQTLNHINLAGIVLGPIILALGWLTRREKPALAWAPPARMALVVLMTVASALSREVVSPKLLAMRRAMGDIIDRIAPNDPRRVAFDAFHHVSVGLMLLNLGAGLTVALLLMAERRREAGTEMSPIDLGKRGLVLGLAICLAGALWGGRPAAGSEMGETPERSDVETPQSPWPNFWLLSPYVGSRISVPRMDPRPNEPLHPTPEDTRRQIPLGFNMGYRPIRLFLETEINLRPNIDRPTFHLIDPSQGTVKAGLQIAF